MLPIISCRTRNLILGCACVLLLATNSLLAQTTQPAATAQSAEAGNPLYQHWAQFKPGAYARYETQSQVAGILYETESQVKLVEKTPEAVVLEITSTTRGPEGQDAPQTRQVRIPAAEGSATRPATRPSPAPGEQRRTYTDTITTPAGTFEAEVTEASIEREHGQVTSKTYLSQYIPGRLIFSEVTGQGLAQNRATTRLVDYSTGGSGEDAQ